jgi:hypothetical protein
MLMRGGVDERQGTAGHPDHTTAMPPIIELCLIWIKMVLILRFLPELKTLRATTVKCGQHIVSHWRSLNLTTVKGGIRGKR